MRSEQRYSQSLGNYNAQPTLHLQEVASWMLPPANDLKPAPPPQRSILEGLGRAGEREIRLLKHAQVRIENGSLLIGLVAFAMAWAAKIVSAKLGVRKRP